MSGIAVCPAAWAAASCGRGSSSSMHVRAIHARGRHASSTSAKAIIASHSVSGYSQLPPKGGLQSAANLLMSNRRYSERFAKFFNENK